MAIFNPGIAIGQISGKVGGSVFSRNRGGSYVRNNAIPSRVVSEKALLQKACLAAAVRSWSDLTDSQRQQWNTYAQTATVTNRLGKSISLTGQNWFVACNSRLLRAEDTPVVTSPDIPAPAGDLISAFTVDAGSGDTEVTMMTSPAGANLKLWIRGAKTVTGAVTNFQNQLTTLIITEANATSPVDLEDELIAAFGPLQAGTYYHIEVRVLDTSTGLISPAFYASAVCANTP